MQSRRVLVTGGAGFIGSHLCERLVADGNEVICLDNLFTGRRQNIRPLLANDNFEFDRLDVNAPFTFFEVDHIYHLACPASPVHYQRNPARTIKTGVLGTLHALELAREVGAKLFIASTSEVYGDPAVHPQTEDYWGNCNPIGPRACYDEAKRCAEALAVSFASQYGTQVRIARIFNTYGPRMAENDGRVVSNFIVQSLRNQPITIYGDGKQTRSFCYVDDLVEAMIRFMDADTDASPVNLGNPVESSILEVAELIREITETEAELIHEPLPVDDPTRRCPNISRAKKLLDWEPKVALRIGLEQTVYYFRQRLAALDSRS
jgi:UDP-glucuronate decarboxylase